MEHAARRAAMVVPTFGTSSADKHRQAVCSCPHVSTFRSLNVAPIKPCSFLLQQNLQQVEALAAHCLAQWGRGSVVTSDRKLE